MQMPLQQILEVGLSLLKDSQQANMRGQLW